MYALFLTKTEEDIIQFVWHVLLTYSASFIYCLIFKMQTEYQIRGIDYFFHKEGDVKDTEFVMLF